MKVALIFGEDDTDREAIRELVSALRPDVPPLQKRRAPLVLVRGRGDAEARKVAASIAKVVAAERVRRPVSVVFAHEDADAVEPAHEPLAKRIEGELAAVGVPAVAVVPAWEMEAWWYLWPAAVAAVNRSWRPLKRSGSVGSLENAKESLRRDLRPKTGGKSVRDYTESDGPRIAAQVRSLGLVHTLSASSASFVRFRDHVLAVAF